MACGTEYGFAQHVSWAELLHGWALMAQGQREQGLAQMRQGLTAYDATQAAQWRPYFLTLLAEGYGQTGATDEGLRLLAEALVAVQHTDEHMWEAELHRLQGELLLQAQHQHPALADDLSHRGRRRGIFAPGARGGPPSAGEIPGATGRHEPGAVLAAAGQARRGAGAARPGLRLVHGGF